MKASTIHELKKELALRSPAEILDLTIRLARYKKENKELLTYLLFESDNEEGYVSSIQSEIDERFAEIPSAHSLYHKIKMIRKVLRLTNKYIKYSPEDTTEVSLRLYFCKSVKALKIPFSRSQALENLYYSNLTKATKLIDKMHEDLRSDYEDEIQSLL